MLSEILVRLPVKSLLICKSVCKPWLHTISNPHFVKFQFRRATIASTNNPTLTSIQTQPTEKRVYRGLLGLPVEGPNSLPCECIVLPLLSNAHLRVVSCCCNGLICLANVLSNDVYIWNPSIRQYKKLPATKRNYANTVKIGFGYDSVSDVYKVFRVVCEKLDDKVLIVQVFSTGTDSWMEFREPIMRSNEVYDSTSVVVDGLLYFYGAHGRIISFDLHKDIFGVVPLPSLTSTRKGSDVLNYEGSVAMVFQIGQERNLWTLDDVSGKVSWTKRFSIDIDNFDVLGIKIWMSQYLGAGQFYRDKLIDHGYRSILSVDVLFDNEKKEGIIYSLPKHRISAPIKYIETLVSLDGFVPVE